MPRSAAPAVKEALIDALETAVAAIDTPGGVLVAWDHPGQRATNTFIFLGDTDETQSPRQLGNGIRQEDFTLEVYAVVHREGDDPKATEDLCWDLVAALEGVLAGPDGASDLGLVDATAILSLTAQFAGVSMRSFVEDGGWTAQASPARVSVSARIR